MALLNNVFGGTSDNVLRDTRRVLQEHWGEPDFPAEALNAEIARTGRSTGLEAAVDRLLAVIYGRQETFLALSLLYDEISWGTMSFHQDHIFPRSLFTPRRLAAAGLTPEQQARYRELVDRVGNVQLLLAQENLEKSDRDFEAWLATRDAGFRRRHLIPEDDSLLKLDRFEEFVEAREALIRGRLQRLFAPAPGETAAAFVSAAPDAVPEGAG